MLSIGHSAVGRRRWAVIGQVALAACVAGGCAKARAATEPDGPPLAVPAPPPRVLAPVEDAPLVASPVEPDAGIAAVPSLPAPPRPARRTNPPGADGSEASGPPAAAAAPAAPAAESPRDLRTAPSSREPVADQQRVEGLLERAERDLNRVVYGKLTPQGKEQYNLSLRYRSEAADALRERNFLRAAESAEKAARIAAALLAGR